MNTAMIFSLKDTFLYIDMYSLTNYTDDTTNTDHLCII